LVRQNKVNDKRSNIHKSSVSATANRNRNCNNCTQDPETDYKKTGRDNSTRNTLLNKRNNTVEMQTKPEKLPKLSVFDTKHCYQQYYKSSN